jgi:hypothetical protein
MICFFYLIFIFLKVFVYNPIKDKFKLDFDKFKEKVTGLSLRNDGKKKRKLLLSY